MLYRRKICLIWKFSKIEKIKSKISSSVKIRTIFHQIWQVSNFQISRALNDVISMMIKKRLRNKVLKLYYNSYRNFWFLVKKKKIEKYLFINTILKMNRIIIRDVNFFFVDDFSEQFADCMMIFFVNLFFDYDQIFLIETFQNLFAFQIFVDLIQMTIFSQKTINFVMQFVKIIIQILINHISRIAFFFSIIKRLKIFKIFNFNVRHVKNKKHIVVDKLFWEFVIEKKCQTVNKKININKWIELK